MNGEPPPFCQIPRKFEFQRPFWGLTNKHGYSKLRTSLRYLVLTKIMVLAIHIFITSSSTKNKTILLESKENTKQWQICKSLQKKHNTCDHTRQQFQEPWVAEYPRTQAPRCLLRQRQHLCQCQTNQRKSHPSKRMKYQSVRCTTRMVVVIAMIGDRCFAPQQFMVRGEASPCPNKK